LLWQRQDSKTSAGIEAEPINLASRPWGGSRARTTSFDTPAPRDLYFPPDDCAAEAALIAGARFERLESVWASGPAIPREGAASRP